MNCDVVQHLVFNTRLSTATDSLNTFNIIDSLQNIIFILGIQLLTDVNKMYKMVYVAYGNQPNCPFHSRRRNLISVGSTEKSADTCRHENQCVQMQSLYLHTM